MTWSTFFRYSLMQRCWELEPKSRPCFSDLVGSLSQSLEAMAGYMDVGAFGELPVQPLESEHGDNAKKHEDDNDHESAEKESKTGDEIKLELFSIDEACTSL